MMKRLTAVACLLCAVEVGLAENRTWESSNGSKVEAEFVKITAESVYLRKSDGSALRVTLTDLVEADQNLARELDETRHQALAATAPVSEALKTLFGEDLRDSADQNRGLAALSGKEVIGVYFSAHWCPPCRAFTPRLVKLHNALSEAGKSFEIVFVSADKDAKAMTTYMQETKMPWLALPYGSEAVARANAKFGVRGIPMLVILDKEGNIISKNGRGEVSQSGAAAYDAWAAKAAK